MVAQSGASRDRHTSSAAYLTATSLLSAAIFIQVLKAEPSNREALLARAAAYLQLADLDMAKRHVGEALKHDPDNQDAMAQFRKLKKLAKLQAQVRWQRVAIFILPV